MEETTKITVYAGRNRASTNNYGSDPFANRLDKQKYTGLSRGTQRKVSNMIRKVAAQGADGVQSKSIETWFTGYDAFGLVQPPYNMDTLAGLYEASAPHSAAVRAKAACIVGLGFKLVESPKTKQKLDKTTNAAALQRLRGRLQNSRIYYESLIDNFNTTDSFIETLMKVWIDYETTGNGYIEIGRTSSGEIGYIGHIPATTMRVRRLKDGFVQIVSNKVVFFRNFKSNTPDPIGNDSRPNEIIHIKKYTPTNTYYGVPDIIGAKTALAGNAFAARYNLDYFENKAVPRHLIIVRGAELENEEELIDFFETGLSGQNHRTLLIPIPSDTETKKYDFKIEAIEAGVQESSFKSYTQANLMEILMAHRTPVTKVSASANMSLANARDADKTFSEQVCQPEQEIFEKKLNKILAEFTDVFLLQLNEMSLTDALTQAQIDQIYLRNDTKVPDEIRAAQGLTGIPGGNQTVGMMAQAKLGKSSGAPAQAAANANQTRQRDQQRAVTAPDIQGESRNPKGDGRQVG